MIADDLIADLWNYLDESRGPYIVSELVRSWLKSRVDHNQRISRELLHELADRRLDWPRGENTTPKPINSFVAQMAGVHPANSVLDPTCGVGLMLQEVAQSASATTVHGIELNPEFRDIAHALLSETATISCADALAVLPGLPNAYDLIVANPPFMVTCRASVTLPHASVQFGGEVGHAIAAMSCAKLSSTGTAIFILTPAFLWSSDGRHAQESILRSGCRIRALIHIPPSAFSHTAISTYLVVFERGEQSSVFIGEYGGDPEHRAALVRNYKRRRAGEHPSAGRLCELESFRGFAVFAAAERLGRLVRASGWTSHPARAVVPELTRFKQSEPGGPAGTSQLFLRYRGKISALIDTTGLPPTALSHCWRLRIDASVADPRYLVMWFNQSPIGQTTLESVMRDGLMPRIDPDWLLNSDFCLPPLSEQHQVLDGLEHLNRVKAEAMELETAIWSHKEETQLLVHQMKTINQQDRYEDWIDTLPFPLASILWRHRASGGSYRERYEILLHFFEATAAFVATIHLSAFMSSDILWQEVAPGLQALLRKQHLSLERASFGAWRATAEYLAGKLKKRLSDEGGRDLCREVYCTASEVLLVMLTHGDILAVLQKANQVRNTSFGHGGAVGHDDAQRIHDELFELVSRVRGLFGRNWLEYELIQPSASRYKGGVHFYTANRLMGTRSAPFETVHRESVHPMESDELYLFDQMGQRGLRLRPFVRVMPSPERKAVACFIFNRCEQVGSRFVSYHFEEESSLTAEFPDLDESFRRFHVFDNREPQ
jgi:hypothetical protein